MQKIPLLIVFFALSVVTAMDVLGQNTGTSKLECSYWRSFVDPTMESREKWDSLSEEQALEGIQCYLAMKGEDKPSRFDFANVGYHTSRRLPGPSIETAALYYVSYIFFENWNHAGAMTLVDKSGTASVKKLNRIAFRSYKAWFQNIRVIGLSEARKRKLNPLEGTGISWYS